MNRSFFNGVPLWSFVVPVTACVILAVSRGSSLGWVPLAAAALIASVPVAVHHAEVIAYRVGEPFGTHGAGLGGYCY